MKNKRLIIIGILILAISVIGKLLYCAIKNIKINTNFHMELLDQA